MRICVFVDYWNLQLTLNDAMGALKNAPGYRAKIDWLSLGPQFSQEAANLIGGVGPHLRQRRLAPEEIEHRCLLKSPSP